MFLRMSSAIPFNISQVIFSDLAYLFSDRLTIYKISNYQDFESKTWNTHFLTKNKRISANKFSDISIFWILARGDTINYKENRFVLRKWNNCTVEVLGWRLDFSKGVSSKSVSDNSGGSLVSSFFALTQTILRRLTAEKIPSSWRFTSQSKMSNTTL